MENSDVFVDSDNEKMKNNCELSCCYSCTQHVLQVLHEVAVALDCCGDVCVDVIVIQTMTAATNVSVLKICILLDVWPDGERLENTEDDSQEKVTHSEAESDDVDKVVETFVDNDVDDHIGIAHHSNNCES